MSSLKDKLLEWFEEQPDQIDPCALLADLTRCAAAVAVKLQLPIDDFGQLALECHATETGEELDHEVVREGSSWN